MRSLLLCGAHMFVGMLVGMLVSLCKSEWVKEMENIHLFQGDMILSPDQMIAVRKLSGNAFGSIRDRTKLWPTDRPIPYTVDASLKHNRKAVQAIRDAVADYHRYTCIRFEEASSASSWGVRFFSGSGCRAPVGYGGNRVHSISLGKGCWTKGIAIHEMAHTMGFFHEHARPDRDNFIRVHWNNIPMFIQTQFLKESTRAVDSLGTPYDYLSVMHYHQKAFGGNKITIETLHPKYQKLIGHQRRFSEMDIKQMNLLYKCSPSPHTVEPTQPTTQQNIPTTTLQTARPSTRQPTRQPTTKQKPTTGQPDSCKDTASNCAQMKEWCRAGGWVHQMKRVCADTCGYC